MIIISITAVFFFGYLFSGLFVGDKLERLSLSFILGLGVFTLCWFLLNLVGIPFTLISGLGLIFTLSMLFFGLSKLIQKEKRKQFKDTSLEYFKNTSSFEKIILVTIIFLLLSSIIGDLYWPVRHWDALTLYDFRAIIFAETGFITKAISYSGFFGYPLLTSLSHTFVYLSGFASPSFIYAFFYISLVTNFFINLKKMQLKRVLVLFLTLLVAISSQIFDHSLTAYTNLPYLTYLVLSSIYLYFGIKNKDIGSFILSSILVGLSTWTRSTEPFWFSCVLVATVFSFVNKKWFWPFIYVTLFGLIMFPWRYFLSLNHVGTANVVDQIISTSYDVLQNFFRTILKPTIDFFMTNVVYTYLAYFILLVVVLLTKLFIRSKEWLFAILIFFDLGLAFAGTLMFVKYIIYWQDISDSLVRMVIFIPIMVIFLFAELLSELKSK